MGTSTFKSTSVKYKYKYKVFHMEIKDTSTFKK